MDRGMDTKNGRQHWTLNRTSKLDARIPMIGRQTRRKHSGQNRTQKWTQNQTLKWTLKWTHNYRTTLKRTHKA